MSALNFDDKTVYLIDGSGYIFRAFFAIRNLKNKSGFPTNAIFGFTKMLLKLLKDHNPKYIAIAFDRKEKTFRHEIFSEYKANRPSLDPDLAVQFDWIYKVVDAFNIKSLSLSGYEADDIIGTLAKKAKEHGRKVVIVTGDKDLMQLVEDDVYLVDELRSLKNGTETFIDKEGVKKELGVLPHQVIDLLALAGDTSDNIPGVKGIGQKTAQSLIEEFGSLESIYDKSPLITQKSRREKLLEGADFAFLSKKLVTIAKDVPVGLEVEDLLLKERDDQKLAEIFTHLDFFSLAKELKLVGHSPKNIQEHTETSVLGEQNYFSVTTKEEFEKLLVRLKEANVIAIDTETDSVDSMKANLVGISLSWAPGQSVYVPLAHDCSIVASQLPIDYVRDHLNRLFDNKNIHFVAQNSKFDEKILTRAGFKTFNVKGDPFIASYLLYQDQAKHNLEELSKKFLGHEAISFNDVVQGKTFAQVDLDTATKYAAEDADLALRINEKLDKELKKQNLSELYEKIELPMVKVLTKMELEGVLVDIEKLKSLKKDLETRLLELEVKAFEVAGQSFNLASPKQVSEILFEKLKLNNVKKTKTGFSTDADVLVKLQHLHALPRILLEHRMCAKLISTYVDVLPDIINPSTGRIHTNYNQCVTATGRLSSSEPNLQNIPIRSSEGKKIRRAFIAKDGYSLIALDYSQMELRLLAYASQCKSLLDAFEKDIDVHSSVASEIFGVPLSLVTKEQRSVAKTINFGLLYGMGVLKLSQTLNISKNSAKEYLTKYFEKYNDIVAWKDKTLANARESLEVRTFFGRKRDLKDLASDNQMLKARAERLAINTPIQGSAADIIKKAMIDTDNFLSKNYPKSKLIMQVHDELVIEAPTEDCEKIALSVSEIMSKGHGLNVFLKVDYAVGQNWDDAK